MAHGRLAITPGVRPAPGKWAASQLPLWVGGALVALVWVGMLGLMTHQRSLDEASALDRSDLLARVMADNANRNVEAAALAAATLGEFVASGLAPDGSEVRTALEQTLVNLPFLRGIALLDARGQVLASEDEGAHGLALDLAPLGPLPPAGQESLGPLVAARGIADLARSAEIPPASGTTRRQSAAAVPAGVQFLPLLRAVALPGGGQPIFVVVQLNPQAFAAFQETLLAEAAAPGSVRGMNEAASAAALLSYEGRLIAATQALSLPPGTLIDQLPPHTRFLPALEHGRWEGPGLRGPNQLAVFRVSASRPLLVVVETDRDAVWAAAGARERSLVAAALAASLLLAGLAWLWHRYAQARLTAQKFIDEAQEEVARSERALSITVKSVQELIFRCDPQGRLSFVNDRWQALTGQPAASATGCRLAERAPPAHQAALEELFHPDGTGLRRVQAPLLAHDGSEHQFEIAVLPLEQDGAVAGFAGSAVDVTRLVQAQRALQAQLAFMRQLMDVSPLPVSVVGLDRRYLLVNKAWEAFTGRPRKQVIGTQVGAHLSLAEQAVHEAKDQVLLAHGQAVRYEAIARHHDGSLRDVQVDKLLLPGPDGDLAGILAVMVDVTEFRNAERATRDARDAAESASRTKSEFIANMSHELRTPLQAITGFSEIGLIRMSAATDHLDGLGEMFSQIHGAGQRMLALVNDLLDLAKVEGATESFGPIPTDLRPLARAVAQELEALMLRRRLQLALRLPCEPLVACVDSGRLQQVLRNLLANAIKFAPEGSEILLELAIRPTSGSLIGADGSNVALGNSGIGGESGHSDPASAAGDSRITAAAVLTVADTGPGVPDDELESIFEPFVQSSATKDGSGGTGLGLTICRKIVATHGGRIMARNRPGGGAVFEVWLPAAGPLPSELADAGHRAINAP
jgi:PAS domain S-box-containing protein